MGVGLRKEEVMRSVLSAGERSVKLLFTNITVANLTLKLDGSVLAWLSLFTAVCGFMAVFETSNFIGFVPRR
jgi:hypothetical protein